MALWVVREQEESYGSGVSDDGESPPRTLGFYTTVALARTAVAMRLRDLYAGGDCFITPCHPALRVQHCWAEDGAGSVRVELPPKKRPDYHDVLTLSIQAHAVDVPPPLDRRPRCWYELEAAVRPPPPPPPPLTEWEVAARAEEEARLEAQYMALLYGDDYLSDAQPAPPGEVEPEMLDKAAEPAPQLAPFTEEADALSEALRAAVHF